jgi:hypothetical protein
MSLYPANETSVSFDLKKFMTSSSEYQLKNYGVTLEAILSEVQERHLCELKDDAFDWLKGEVAHASHGRNTWCNPISCNRAEALKHKHNGFTSGELGTGYFYFEHEKKRPFTEEEVDHLYTHPSCCYMRGQSCFGDDEDEYEGEPCECEMGRQNGSYIFGLDIGDDTIAHEKQCGVWKEEEEEEEEEVEYKYGVPLQDYPFKNVVDAARSALKYEAADVEDGAFTFTSKLSFEAAKLALASVGLTIENCGGSGNVKDCDIVPLDANDPRYAKIICLGCGEDIEKASKDGLCDNCVGTLNANKVIDLTQDEDESHLGKRARENPEEPHREPSNKKQRVEFRAECSCKENCNHFY